MSPLRLVLVTQRFWPLVGRSATVMGHLAAELVARGALVTVLTIRWHPTWPGEITCRGVPVLRLGRPPGHRLDTARTTGALARWLRKHRRGYDLVCVSGLRHEAYAAISAVGGEAPVVLRAEAAGRQGDCLWQLDARGGRRIKKLCMQADALIGPTRQVERELIAAGYPRERIHFLPHGVPIPPARDAARRLDARAALTGASAGLYLSDEAPLAVAIGQLQEAKGLGYLVAAWQQVAAARPDARLWLVGEGPYRTMLEGQIARLDLRGRVFLAGVFDNIEELLAAADLFVLPSREEGPSLALLEAMAAGLPIVASDIAGTREVVEHGQTGLLVPSRDPEALASAILRLLDRPDAAARLGAAARAAVQSRFALGAMVDAHLTLFESLILVKSRQVSR